MLLDMFVVYDDGRVNIHNACAACLLEEATVVSRSRLAAAGESPASGGLGGSEASSGPGGLTEDLGVHLENGLLVVCVLVCEWMSDSVVV